MTRWCARLAALLLVGFFASVPPCQCAAAAATGPAEHCATSAPGVRAAHDGCACPCMTSSGGDVADRPEAEARASLASTAAAPPPHGPGVALAQPTPRAEGAPERATASPPPVLRI